MKILFKIIFTCILEFPITPLLNLSQIKILGKRTDPVFPDLGDLSIKWKGAKKSSILKQKKKSKDIKQTHRKKGYSVSLYS